MKIRITMKTPDAVSDAVNDAITDKIEEFKEIGLIEAGSEEQFRDDTASDLGPLMMKWFKYGEIVTLEVDTELETCVVVPT